MAANSGCSNVGDGQRGLETAPAMQAATAEELGLEPGQVGVASTGVIGTELPRDPVVAGVRDACGALGGDAGAFSEAILTSDAGPKRACLEVALRGGTVRLAAPGEGRRHDRAALTPRCSASCRPTRGCRRRRSTC